MIGGLSPLLGFLAGALSILSPCVLPLVPIVFGSAGSRHPSGPLALGLGLALSFTLIGIFVATVGYSIGLDGQAFRTVGGALLIAAGLVLAIPLLQQKFATASAPIGNWANSRMANDGGRGLLGQFSIGALLGLVWLQCVGPTLGAASILAAQGKNLGEVASVMLAFAIGAAVPLTAIGGAEATALAGRKNALAGIGSYGKRLLGLAFILVGALILSGIDHMLEAYLTQVSPGWLVALSTRY